MYVNIITLLISNTHIYYLPTSVTEISYFNIYTPQIIQQFVQSFEFANFSKITI